MSSSFSSRAVALDTCARRPFRLRTVTDGMHSLFKRWHLREAGQYSGLGREAGRFIM